ESAVRRFRPITLTAAAAVLALIPLAREVFWAPMALAMMGGVIAATVLTLTFLPALYALAFRVAARSIADARLDAATRPALPAPAYPALARFGPGLRLPNPPPQLLAGKGHIEVGDAEGGERVEHRADHRRGRADGTRFPAALGAERIVGAGLALVAFGDEQRQIVGARHRVVHERAADELAAAIVGATLEQRLADALGKAAVNLALDDHRIDDGADVVDAPEPDDLDAAGVRVDLELADMRPVAEGEARRIVDRGLLQAGLDGLERKVVR